MSFAVLYDLSGPSCGTMCLGSDKKKKKKDF